LNLFAKHLASRPVFELNTPFSIERSSSSEDDVEIISDESRTILQQKLTGKKPKEPSKDPVKDLVKELSKSVPTPEKTPETKMSFQEPHPALLIPGPVEIDDDVAKTMGYHR
jgi:alanine-glyoxylate transaminase/serine-glyoxylate transaminase/serine-pyruvate transaminase